MTSVIKGTVSDLEATGIEDATVTIIDASDGRAVRETQTDANGAYRVSVTNPVTYDVRASKFGYDPAEKTVSVGSNETETVNFTINRADYKTRGVFEDRYGSGVEGRNTAASGTPIGVLGAVPDAADGFGLATPDDLGIAGLVDTRGTDFVVRAGDASGDATNVVMGEPANTATSGTVGAVIGGGGFGKGSNANRVAAAYATISGGFDNTASGSEATVGGGFGNTASGKNGTVGGGTGNTASDRNATVGGGGGNDALGSNASVGGGLLNGAFAPDSTIGGGEENTTGKSGSTTASHATVGGGLDNDALGTTSAIGGGETNRTGQSGTGNGDYATVGGGRSNDAFGGHSTIGGGRSNRTGQSGAFTGRHATVPGGRNNTASKDYTFAAGYRAKATNRGSFVWGDSTDVDVTSTSGDQFIVEAGGGVGLGTTQPLTQLHVADGISGGALPENHVAFIENTESNSADVLSLKIDENDPLEVGNNFITFRSADGNIGAIEGNGGGGINLNTSSGDYAEYLPRLNPEEAIEPAEVVGVVGGGVTKRTGEADQALVVSDRSIVTGNSPGIDSEDRKNHEVCAFVGQVPVRIRGSVEAGDLVVPSGGDDGIARAVTPSEWRPGDGPLVGRAWEGDDEAGVSEVTVSVGIDDPTLLSERLAGYRDRIEHLEAKADHKDARIKMLERETARIDDLEAENELLRERLAALEAQVGTGAAPADD